MSKNKDFLLEKIADLESQLVERKKELSLFRQEFELTNNKLDKLVSKMKSELLSLQKLQTHLMPTEFPTIPGFEFSTKFVAGSVQGGDYYDIITQADKSKFGILMASCSSYIVSALLMSTVLRNMQTIEANKNANPSFIVTKIIDSMQDGIEVDHSLDLFYATFDRKKFELNYLLLGDVFVVHQMFSSSKLSLIDSNYSELKKTSHYELKERVIKLNPKDRLIFITKGAHLAQGRNDNNFGKEKLLQAILNAPKTGAHELRNYILYTLNNFNSNEKLNRDITIVVAEVKDRVIKLA